MFTSENTGENETINEKIKNILKRVRHVDNENGIPTLFYFDKSKYYTFHNLPKKLKEVLQITDRFYAKIRDDNDKVFFQLFYPSRHIFDKYGFSQSDYDFSIFKNDKKFWSSISIDRATWIDVPGEWKYNDYDDFDGGKKSKKTKRSTKKQRKTRKHKK
jgi:hypothetical protein